MRWSLEDETRVDQHNSGHRTLKMKKHEAGKLAGGDLRENKFFLAVMRTAFCKDLKVIFPWQ